ncbi:hypothetical protein [Natronorubrum halophilum]|nr:hypothetical protein [Natronorubrum halophilum]
MTAIEPTDPTELESTDQSDVPVYMPGTPTLGFTNFLERLADVLRR